MSKDAKGGHRQADAAYKRHSQITKLVPQIFCSIDPDQACDEEANQFYAVEVAVSLATDAPVPGSGRT